MKTTDKLIKFVNQRSGLNSADYAGYREGYLQDLKRVLQGRRDFKALFTIAERRLGDTLEDKLTEDLTKQSGRLSLNDKGDLTYCTGQYFPTEYRQAACRILVNLIWSDFRDEKKHNTEIPVYTTGPEIRKAIGRLTSRKALINRWFN